MLFYFLFITHMKKTFFGLVASIVLVALASCGTSTPKMDVTQYDWEGAGSTQEGGQVDSMWAFRYVDGAVQFQIGGETGAANAASEATISGNQREFHIKAVDSKFEAKLKEDKKGCSDGVTDAVYPYRAEVKFDGVEYKGCGREFAVAEIQGATQRSVTVETGSGTQATITNTAVQTTDGQVVGAVTVSTGATDQQEVMSGAVEVETTDNNDEMEADMTEENAQ